MRTLVGVVVLLLVGVACEPTNLEQAETPATPAAAEIGEDPVVPAVQDQVPAETPAHTTTTLAPDPELVRIELVIMRGVATPLRLWDPSGPTLIGDNPAEPVPVFIAWGADGPNPHPAIVGVSLPATRSGLPIVGDFDGDGLDDISGATELFQESLDPRNGGCGTADGLSNAFLPSPVDGLRLSDEGPWGICQTWIDPTQGGSVFFYSWMPPDDGDPLLGDFVLDFEPEAAAVFEGFLEVDREAGTGRIFGDDEDLFGEFESDDFSPFFNER